MNYCLKKKFSEGYNVEIKKKIIKIMSGSYEPTLADSIRIYKEYCINKGEVSAILSEVYKWLAQNHLKEIIRQV